MLRSQSSPRRGRAVISKSIFVLLVGMKAMTRYYFDVRDDHCLALDDEGVELSNVDAVQ